MPPLARAHYRREVVAWLLISTMMGAVAGGVVGVIVKNAFAGKVPDQWLNLSVALVTGAQSFAHLTSFLWASLSHGRHKIRFLVGLQLAAAGLVAAIALAPVNVAGLVMFTVGAVLIQACWSGVVTLRTTVWRANYPRNARARTAGKIATFQAIMMFLSSIIVGLTMRWNPGAFHLLFPLAAAFGLIGAAVYSRMKMRSHRLLLANERWGREDGSSTVDLLKMWRILRDDKLFRRYMGAMFIFGIGNLSASSLLVIVVRDAFGYEYLAGIAVTASIPILIMPLSIPFWSKLLDRMHILRFRSIHCWSFITANLAILIAVLTLWHPLLWAAAVIRGLSFGGGMLGWNLGHHDFTTAASSSQYMGIHVTLTGIRGLIGPLAAVALYELFNEWSPGAGAWVFALCLGTNLIGAALFILLKRTLDDEEAKGLSKDLA